MDNLEEVTVLLVTHVNVNNLDSIFSSVAVFIINQQIYQRNGLFSHTSYLSKNFNRTISECKGLLHCRGFDYGEFPNEITEIPLSGRFLQGE